MISVWVDALGHLGYIFIALGIFLLTKKNIWGWVFRFTGEFTWLVIGILIDMSSIWLWGFLFLALDAYGFYCWHHDRKLLENLEKEP